MKVPVAFGVTVTVPEAVEVARLRLFPVIVVVEIVPERFQERTVDELLTIVEGLAEKALKTMGAVGVTLFESDDDADVPTPFVAFM